MVQVIRMAEAVDGDGDETTRSSSHDDEVSMRKSELEWVAKHSKHRGSVRDLAGRFSGSSKAMSQEELAEFQKNQVCDWRGSPHTEPH